MAFSRSCSLDGDWLSVPATSRLPETSTGLDLLLYSGGGAPADATKCVALDSLDPARDPADTEIWFSATTGIRPGPRARAGVREALVALAVADRRRAPLTDWFGALRRRIAAAASAPEAAVLLAPTVAEAQEMARCLSATAGDEVEAEIGSETEFSAGDAIAAGRMAILDGSHFFGGPTHCAALLAPPGLVSAAELSRSPRAFGLRVAALDIPGRLRRVFADEIVAPVNVGLALRWSGALGEIERHIAIPEATRALILETFQRRARALAARLPFIEVEAGSDDLDYAPAGFAVNLFALTATGEPVGLIAASAVRAGLAVPRPDMDGDAICHVGAIGRIDGRLALPVSISAPMISDVADRLARGVSFDRAIAPVWRDLGTLFSKWATLVGDVQEVSTY